uniref:G-2 and S-phase expressed 1 n=1 Tax=Tetraodon nigroviridis TaxID=99883 RepID=H3DF62_TETNG
MDCRANDDLFFLHEEKFDFDISMSPASSNGDEDEDEVFVEPVSHKERCTSTNVETQLSDGQLRSSWSPLSGDQLEAVCQEAHRLASQLQGGERSRSHSEHEDTTSAVMTQPEEFVQDSGAKLNVFEQSNRVLSPIKRETFCVQDSPLKQLPPAIQQRLLRSSINTNSSSARRASTNPKSIVQPASVARLSTSSPVARARSQPRTGLRGKAPLGVVLPSKPAAPAASASTSRPKVEKNRLQPPSRPVVGRKCSPTRRAESSEDLLSDSASVTSDISDSSINSSLLGKRNPAPPIKVMIAVCDIVSSGKLNSSLNRSVCSSTGPAPSRARRSTINAAAEPAPSIPRCRSLSTQAKKATPLKRAEGTPTKRALEKSGSVPATSTTLPQGRLKTKAKPEALVPPTLSAGVRGLNHGDIWKLQKPKRLVSVSSMDSLPQKPSAGPLSPSTGVYKAVQAKPGRPSALPTPVRRRVSAIPVATPTNQNKPTKPPPKPKADLTPKDNSGDKGPSCSLNSTDGQEPEPSDPSTEPDDPSIQPFCLEEGEEELPVVTPSSPPQPDQSESSECGATHQERESGTRNLIELETTEESSNKTQEPQEKLLIDLTNTPNLIRTSNKCCAGPQVDLRLLFLQLIDLSSPLIKWSPENKSENVAPLINLSF